MIDVICARFSAASQTEDADEIEICVEHDMQEDEIISISSEEGPEVLHVSSDSGEEVMWDCWPTDAPT
eukprot:11407625-Karenia_brevis.AAC.1